MTKLFLTAICFAALAFAGADDKKPVPIPEPEIFKLQYYEINARMLVVQYDQMRKDFEQKFQDNQKAMTAVISDIYKKTGLDQHKYTFDLPNKVLVPIEAPAAPKVQPAGTK